MTSEMKMLHLSTGQVFPESASNKLSGAMIKFGEVSEIEEARL